MDEGVRREMEEGKRLVEFVAGGNVSEAREAEDLGRALGAAIGG